MMNALKETPDGKWSVVRICLLLCVLTACTVAIMVAASERSLNDALGVITALLAVPFVNKVWQKDKE